MSHVANSLVMETAKLNLMETEHGTIIMCRLYAKE